jgi:hypothetical protein
MAIRLVFVATLVLILCLTVPIALAGGETEPTLRITISPISGNPGTDISVTGEGARPNIPVKVMVVRNGDTGEGLINQVDVDPADNGTFSATIKVPEGTENGSYAVRAEQRNQAGGVIHFWWVGFQVGSGGALLPVTGILPGTSITITAALAALLVVALIGQGVRRALRR